LILDTSVVASALRSRYGASNVVLRFGLSGTATLLASTSLFLEYEDVLLRPEQRLVHGLSLVQVNEFLEELAGIIEPVEIHYRWRPQVTDPGDEMVLEAAMNGRANALVTHNIRHFAPAGLRFKLPILTPQQVIKEIGV
jgi:putative PIN family toxin of toxin-antitoxin system